MILSICQYYTNKQHAFSSKHPSTSINYGFSTLVFQVCINPSTEYSYISQISFLGNKGTLYSSFLGPCKWFKKIINKKSKSYIPPLVIFPGFPHNFSTLSKIQTLRKTLIPYMKNKSHRAYQYACAGSPHCGGSQAVLWRGKGTETHNKMSVSFCSLHSQSML